LSRALLYAVSARPRSRWWGGGMASPPPFPPPAAPGRASAAGRTTTRTCAARRRGSWENPVSHRPNRNTWGNPRAWERGPPARVASPRARCPRSRETREHVLPSGAGAGGRGVSRCRALSAPEQTFEVTIVRRVQPPSQPPPAGGRSRLSAPSGGGSGKGRSPCPRRRNAGGTPALPGHGHRGVVRHAHDRLT